MRTINCGCEGCKALDWLLEKIEKEEAKAKTKAQREREQTQALEDRLAAEGAGLFI